jgi:WD40-like Beta Propeller Repeat
LLAVVRGGVIWAGRPGRLRKIGVGGEPSWSPHGALIAAAQRGWIVIIGVRGGRVRRLVRGAAPAFSPDGRWIAYVAPDHRLMIVGVAGRHLTPRAVGNVRAVSVDWQPKPSRSHPACSAPPGSTVLASSPAAVVTADGVLHPDELSNPSNSSNAYMGCPRADGRERLLERLGAQDYDVYFVRSAVLAAPYAGLVREDVNGHDDTRTSSLQVFDLRTGRLQTKLGGEFADCPEGGPPCPGLDHVVLGSDGVSAAHTQSVDRSDVSSIPHFVVQVSCAPATTVCVALDAQGVLSSADPSGGAQTWKVATINLFVPAMIDCPSTALCVGLSGPNIDTSINPAADPSVWTTTVLPFGVLLPTYNEVSCPSVKLCVVGGFGSVTTSTNPTGGASAWSISTIDRNRALNAIFCSTQPQCFTSDTAGTVWTSTDPAGGAAAWRISTSSPPFTSGTCPTSTLCVAVNGHDLQATTNPGGGTWMTQAVADDLDSVACPSASLCLAVGAAGALDVSTNPASGLWTHTTIDQGQQLNSITCPSASLCVAADSAGRVVSSTDPTGGPSTWTPALLDPCADTTPCSSEQIQASDSAGLHSVDASELPGSGPFLTGPTLTGDVLYWNHNETPQTLSLTP